MVHRTNIIDYLFDVARAIRSEDIGFRREQVLEGALRPLDLAREHRLFPHIHHDEEIGMGQRLDRAVEPAERPICIRKQALHLAAEIDRRVGR